MMELITLYINSSILVGLLSYVYYLNLLQKQLSLKLDESMKIANNLIDDRHISCNKNNEYMIELINIINKKIDNVSANLVLLNAKNNNIESTLTKCANDVEKIKLPLNLDYGKNDSGNNYHNNDNDDNDDNNCQDSMFITQSEQHDVNYVMLENYGSFGSITSNNNDHNDNKKNDHSYADIDIRITQVSPEQESEMSDRNYNNRKRNMLNVRKPGRAKKEKNSNKNSPDNSFYELPRAQIKTHSNSQKKRQKRSLSHRESLHYIDLLKK
jgi:hypothetical protein